MKLIEQMHRLATFFKADKVLKVKYILLLMFAKNFPILSFLNFVIDINLGQISIFVLIVLLFMGEHIAASHNEKCSNAE